MKTVRDYRVSAGQILPPLLDLIWRSMEGGSNEPVGIGKVSVVRHVNDDWRGIRA
jgi:hypothetical protein